VAAESHAELITRVLREWNHGDVDALLDGYDEPGNALAAVGLEQ